MKKTYITPDAEYISFYTEEEITAVGDISQYAMEGEGDNSISGKYEIVDGELGWT